MGNIYDSMATMSIVMVAKGRRNRFRASKDALFSAFLKLESP